MQTFSQSLSSSAWTEVLNSGTFIAFDLESATTIKIIMTETAASPALDADCNEILSYPSSWDFEASGLEATVQRIWLKGDNKVIGVRG